MKKLICLFLTALMLCAVLVGCGGNPAVTDDPITDDPVTDAPFTDDPVTDAPMTDAPITDAPFTDDPITDAPITDAPMTDAPADDAAKIIGTWTGEWDRAEEFYRDAISYYQLAYPELDYSVNPFLTKSTCSVSVVFDNTQKGSQSFVVTEATKQQVREEADAWYKQLWTSIFVAKAEKEIAEQGLDMDVDTYLASQGDFLDELVAEKMSEDDSEYRDLMDTLERYLSINEAYTFEYRVINGKVHVTFDDYYGETWPYSFDGNDQLTLTFPYDTGEPDVVLTFHRAD